MTSDTTADEGPLVAPADFVVGGSPGGEVSVKISYGIIDRFSEGLYSSPNKAFEELVSNSYDAGARRVWVSVPEVLDGHARLAVIDDGVSMDLDGLAQLWRVGVSPKRAADGTEVVHAGRPPIGKFGIGKLATYVLAHKLTYICHNGGRTRAVTMDYGKARGEVTDPAAMSLTVVELDESETRSTLETALGADSPAIAALLGSDRPESWTAAILSDLKPRGFGIQLGRLRWILRSALPLGDQFRLWVNAEQIDSTKLDLVPDWEFIVGENDKTTDAWPYATLVAVNDDGLVGVDLPDVGFVRGQAQLFERSLKGGRSDDTGRSHGFFVKVRERLVNLDDETFGIDVELHHGVLTRFRMVVHADGLDPHIASPRESVQDSPALKTLRLYLLAVFNRARSYRAAAEDKSDKDLLAAKERIALPPPALSTAPMRRVIRRAIVGDEAVREMMGLDRDSVEGAEAALESEDGSLLQLVLLEPLGHERPLVTYDLGRRAAVVNADHPFVSNYLDVHGAAEPLRLVGVTELLTQVYMLDEDLPVPIVQKILRRRDEFLRALVNLYPSSAPVVARQLRDSKGQKDELEDAVADALELLGFDVTRLGGAGRPDGIARTALGAREEGGGSRSYSIAYDAKSSSHDAIKAATAGTQTLRKHREAFGATYSLLVAPGYQGADEDAAAITKNCENDRVTPITVDLLADVVAVFPFRSLTPESMQTLFDLHAPKAVEEWVEDLQRQAASAPAPPIQEILALTKELSDRQDAVTIAGLSTALKVKHGIEIAVGPLRGLVRGLAALAPDGLWYEPDSFALNASIPSVLRELRSTLQPMDDAIAGVFKKALGVDGDDA